MSFIRIAARFLETKTVGPLAFVVRTMAAAALLGMVLVTMIDITGRRFGLPILGTYEIVSYLLVVTFFFALCYTGTQKFHHAIEMVTSRFPPQNRFYLLTVMYLIAAIMCGLISRQTAVYALAEMRHGVTGYLLTSVPVYPFIFVASFSLLIQSWLFLVQSIYFLGEATGRED